MKNPRWQYPVTDARYEGGTSGMFIGMLTSQLGRSVAFPSVSLYQNK